MRTKEQNNPLDVFDYDTEHDTVNRTMTHTFPIGFSMCVDFKEKVIISAKKGIVFERQTDFNMVAYERALIAMAEADFMLGTFKVKENEPSKS